MFANLDSFYSVQLCSGHDSLIFLTRDEATKAASEWDKEVERSLEKGENNYAQSVIDCDGVYYSINPVYLSGPIYYHEVGKAPQARWNDHPSAHKIKWGNPAIQRVEKARSN
jgi:hypothetical protein